MTALDYIKRAMRKLGVVAANESPSADEAQDGLTVLNSMLHRWKIESIDLAHVDFTLTSVPPFPQSHDDPIVNNLAVEFASEFGRPLPQEVAVLAGLGKTALMNLYANPADAAIDDALNPCYSPNGFNQ